MNILKKIIKEACAQAWNNRKSYSFLSVTIVLTFTIIGFYMVYLDSDIYNAHKSTMRESSKVAFINYDENEISRVKALENKLEEMKDTHYYETSEIAGFDILRDLTDEASFVMNVLVIPNDVWGYFWGAGNRVEMSDGDKSIKVGDDEIIVSESFNKLIEKLSNNKDKQNIDFFYGKKLKVAGTFKDFVVPKSVDEKGHALYHFYTFISENTAKGFETFNKELVIYSPEIGKIQRYAGDLALSFWSNYDDKVMMNREIVSSIEVKKMIIIALMVILGINMLSSFFNALNERKFEIAVKRATGASRGQIIFQFLVEGFVVIGIDIVISIVAIIMGLTVIKIYNFLVYDERWTIHITSYSIMIFFICCTFLALFFSIVFSVLTTRVEIIKYIKGE